MGNSILRQIIGIPMGTNCAPVLANIFLYVYEADYITRMEKLKGLGFARSFHNTYRLIDDVLSVDNPNIQEALSKPAESGGLYPKALTLNPTSSSIEEVDFIGIHIVATKSRFHLSVYDKRKSFPFYVRRYPRLDSLIPKNIAYGVLTGQLHRVYDICSGVDDFLKEAVEIAERLQENGCSSHKLRCLFKAFVSHHVIKYPNISKTRIMQRFVGIFPSRR